MLLRSQALTGMMATLTDTRAVLLLRRSKTCFDEQRSARIGAGRVLVLVPAPAESVNYCAESVETAQFATTTMTTARTTAATATTPTTPTRTTRTTTAITIATQKSNSQMMVHRMQSSNLFFQTLSRFRQLICSSQSWHS